MMGPGDCLKESGLHDGQTDGLHDRQTRQMDTMDL